MHNGTGTCIFFIGFTCWTAVCGFTIAEELFELVQVENVLFIKKKNRQITGLFCIQQHPASFRIFCHKGEKDILIHPITPLYHRNYLVVYFIIAPKLNIRKWQEIEPTDQWNQVFYFSFALSKFCFHLSSGLNEYVHKSINALAYSHKCQSIADSIFFWLDRCSKGIWACARVHLSAFKTQKKYWLQHI